MANVASCTQFDNYGPRQIYYTGHKLTAYDFIVGTGVKYANGSTYVGDGTSPQPAPRANATHTPNCRSCHGGC